MRNSTTAPLAAGALGCLALAAAALLPPAPAASADDAGKRIYTENCSVCHQADGSGVPDTFPPLAKNADVKGDAAAVIRVVLRGRKGKLAVNGHTYDGEMPAWGDKLSDADVAAVVSYIRTSWGNGAAAVTAADVAAARK